MPASPLDLSSEFQAAAPAAAYVHSLLSYATSFALGTLIGVERQWRQRSAGLRTVVLVAVGAAAFADLGTRLLGAEGATRIVAYVVSGIGFLGAGVILKDGANIRGLNTAATLWCSAAVGALSGSRMGEEAVTLAFFILAGNTLLRPLVNSVNRRPLTLATAENEAEAEAVVHATCDAADATAARRLVSRELARASCPAREIATVPGEAGEVELAAVLLPAPAEPDELDALAATLARSPLIRAATWSVQAAS